MPRRRSRAWGAWLACLAGLTFGGLLGPGPWARGDEAPGPEGGKEEGKEEGEDLGDKEVPFHEQVNKALTEGVHWLLARPDYFAERDTEFAHFGLIKGERLYGGGDGPQYRHPAGPTALALYTLLKCEVDPDHPVIQKGFNWLREVHTITERWDGQDGQGFTWHHTQAGSAYEISAMILALTAKYDQHKKTSASKSAVSKGKLKIRDPKDREWMQELVDGLVARRGMPTEGGLPKERLGWRYNAPVLTLGGGRGARWTRRTNAPPHANQDLSSTQLAALALYSAQRFGIKVDPQVWLDIVAFTLDHQEPDGPEHERHNPGYQGHDYGPIKDRARGFVYIKGSSDGTEGVATGSMTACGLANLLIAREALAKDNRTRKHLVDSGLLKQIDTSLNDGLAWLDRNWSSFTNPASRYGYHIYYLYCVERAMDILGKRLVGKRLWYPLGAQEILARQRPVTVKVPLERKGTEERPGVFWMTDSTHEPKDVLDTCFALLYLKRATHGLVPGGPVVTGD